MPNALLPDYARCGGRGKEKRATAKKRVTAEIRAMFRAVITLCFAKNRKLDLQGAYEEVISAEFSDRVIDERSGRQTLVIREDFPSFRQFQYWYRKDNDIFILARRRHTPRVYDKDKRALLGSSLVEVRGPGSRYQIDATIADIYLVSRYDRSRIVGRPVLYLVIDVFSRIIVGVYVGFEGPSWVGAMMALANAASDKVAFCEEFGLEIGAADWPCQGLPDILLGDRAEMMSRHVETLINHFNVHVENTPPYRPDWKGVVERRFGLLPARFKAYVAGYVEWDFQARGGSDYRLDAELDIDQFTRVVLYCILYYNNHHLIGDYEKSPQMLADKVDAVPIELWDWGISHRTGTPRSFPPELVRLSLLPTDEAVVTKSGISYRGCFYSCQKVLDEHWFEKARQKRKGRKPRRVQISYDPRCMDAIYLHDKGDRLEFIVCALTEKSRHHRGKTLWEIEQIRKDEARRQRGHERWALQARINTTAEINEVVAEAQAMRPEPSATSKRAHCRHP